MTHHQSKENKSVNERLAGLGNTYATESERLRGELGRLRGVEEDARSKGNQLNCLLEELEKLKKELSTTRQEKKTIEDWAQSYKGQMEKVRSDLVTFLSSFLRVLLVKHELVVSRVPSLAARFLIV